MLALTPVPLQTAGERALFAELARWDTGGSVRAAVVASIPLGDGQVQRRISDAILFVPEGIAVVRIAEVQRQSGIVTASPEGPWTIAPESGTSQVLQLAGGGSTPLDGLMRAGMDTAMKLRHAGLEPGRIARLTVLVGEVSGLVPADGDLGEGDQVATLEPRSLLLGIARASRYASVDNPRLWTTADVRAALEALGLQGRGPSVEELNGEGFPYSPYVLRRPELLTPAAMAANSTAATDDAVALTPAPVVPSQAPAREQPSAAAIAQAVAASAAAAQAAEAPVSTPAVVPPQRDTVAINQPSTPAPSSPAAPVDDDGGIGGLVTGAQPIQPAVPEAPPRTSVFPVTPPAAPASPPPPPTPAAAPFSYWTESVTAAPEDGAEERAPRGRTLLLIAAGLTVLLLVGIGGWLLLGRDSEGGGGGSAGGSTAGGGSAPGPVAGDVQNVAGVDYTVEAVQVDDTCAGHAYGEVAEFLTTTDCTGLSRALYSSETEAGAVVISVIRVQMPDTATARDLRTLADRNGSGNVSDLLREGVRYTGSPAELSGAEYASALSGPTVTIVESAWADPDARGPSSDIDRVATDALALRVPPLPEG
ncbi:MAG: hypothetical protein ABWY29_07940 [Blastococcus sp.]